jgi:hypothetical protein
MTVAEFEALKSGDLIEAGSLFPKLSDDKTTARVTSRRDGQVKAVGSWMGVTLGVWIGEVIKDKVEWSFA